VISTAIDRSQSRKVPLNNFEQRNKPIPARFSAHRF
jgi:hypothetical protein